MRTVAYRPPPSPAPPTCTMMRTVAYRSRAAYRAHRMRAQNSPSLYGEGARGRGARNFDMMVQAEFTFSVVPFLSWLSWWGIKVPQRRVFAMHTPRIPKPSIFKICSIAAARKSSFWTFRPKFRPSYNHPQVPGVTHLGEEFIIFENIPICAAIAFFNFFRPRDLGKNCKNCKKVGISGCAAPPKKRRPARPCCKSTTKQNPDLLTIIPSVGICEKMHFLRFCAFSPDVRVF